jgi:hypothetical protein
MKDECAFIRPFLLAGALLMMLDGLTTYLALQHVADAREANPIGVWAIDTVGLAGMCVAKGIVGVWCVWRLACVAERGHKWEWMNRSLLLRPKPAWKVQRSAIWTLAFTVTLMGVVVGNNLNVIVSG